MNPQTKAPIQRKPSVLGLAAGLLPAVAQTVAATGAAATAPRAASDDLFEQSLGKSGERAALWPSVLIGDVNGDTRSDLLVQNGREELRVYLGVPGPDLFTRRSQKVAVAMPNEEYTWLVDLHKDGKQDLLMHHPSTTAPHRVTVLIAR